MGRKPDRGTEPSTATSGSFSGPRSAGRPASSPRTGVPVQRSSSPRRMPPATRWRSRTCSPARGIRADGLEVSAVVSAELAEGSPCEVERADRHRSRSRAGSVRVRAARPGSRARHVPFRTRSGVGSRFASTPHWPTEEALHMKATEKIWMNGELVDSGDAKVHIGVARPPLRHRRLRGHPLLRDGRTARPCSGSGAPRAARLRATRPMKIPYSASRAPGGVQRALGANGLPECYIRPVAFSATASWGSAAAMPGRASRSSAGRGARTSARRALENGIRAKISSWGRSPNVIRHQGDGQLPELDPRQARGDAAGYDEAILLDPRATSPRLRREHLRREARRDPRPDLSAVDPRGHHARLDHPDRPGPRLPSTEKNLIRSDL